MPQTENGFTQIANELIEQFARIRIPGEAMQVFWVMLRKIYGFHKKSDPIALSQIVAATGLSKIAVCKAVKKLIELNLITKKGNKIAAEYAINKHFDTWEPLPKKVTLPKKVICVTKKGNLPLPKKDTTKETITKENKERKESEILPSDYYQKTLKALGLPSTGIISPKDHTVLVALLKDNCNFDDIEQARIKRKKNRLEWIQDSVCELRDARLATVAKPDENGIPILPNGYMDWDNMTFEQKQFAIQRGYER
jgi:phage replication O-like protein O